MVGLGALTTPSNGITNWVREFRAGDDKRSGFLDSSERGVVAEGF
jgi:hypothetical protein